MDLSRRKKNIGLESGISKEILFKILISHHNGSVQLRRKAEDLLDELSDLLSDCTDYSFNHGITGVGWMIEFLAQKQLICIDTDEVLEEIDDNCYKMTLNILVQNTYDIRDILGLLQYHHIRSESKNKNQIFYRHFIHNECIALLSDRLVKYIKENVSSLQKNDIEPDEIVLLSFCLLQVSQLLQKNVKFFEKEFYEAIEILLNYFKEIHSKSNSITYFKNIYINLEICIYTLMSIKQYDNPHWQNFLEKIYFDLVNNLKQQDYLNNKSFQKIKILDQIYKDSILNLNVLELLSLMDHSLLHMYLSNYSHIEISEYLSN
ncbi:hypothetical protein [Sphingobacterium bovisgrunnientis]|uniref:hypothetical protein n=1 Tax=Sphingobacterium bovisgrunnientis TaxID=1874697 RepID=UPI001357A9B8|nr:hypothetical protein [Sphingobacterium bovisgrunnientis]